MEEYSSITEVSEWNPACFCSTALQTCSLPSTCLFVVENYLVALNRNDSLPERLFSCNISLFACLCWLHRMHVSGWLSDGGKWLTCSWAKVMCTKRSFIATLPLIPAAEGRQEQVGEPDADAAA